jgi:hypothetical protein
VRGGNLDVDTIEEVNDKIFAGKDDGLREAIHSLLISQFTNALTTITSRP